MWPGLFFFFYCVDGDTQLNLDPKRSSWESFSFYTVALTVLLPITMQNYHFLKLTLSAKYFESSVARNDINLALPGYPHVRSEHQLNCKRGGVCNYYKTLSYVLEYRKFDVKICGKLYNFTIVFSLILILLLQKLLI